MGHAWDTGFLQQVLGEAWLGGPGAHGPRNGVWRGPGSGPGPPPLLPSLALRQGRVAGKVAGVVVAKSPEGSTSRPAGSPRQATGHPGIQPGLAPGEPPVLTRGPQSPWPESSRSGWPCFLDWQLQPAALTGPLCSCQELCRRSARMATPSMLPLLSTGAVLQPAACRDSLGCGAGRARPSCVAP